ncbi:hypothetical protein [Wolbachia endosymbiont of Litomosoides brasiliensis]|uniref:hypothetical protein n=1 Tax=Wolbachia endosymbiont of Litomosoides brasiliensis TaxID=1812117 RepID=UPI001FE99069|nr:hypothetical protein [Wolbachia endosymbiont of Litomosoides brasiliensis]
MLQLLTLLAIIISVVFFSHLGSVEEKPFLYSIELKHQRNFTVYKETTVPLWPFTLPALLFNFYVLACGLVFSIVASVLLLKKSKEFLRKMSDLTLFVLKALLTPVILILVFQLAPKMKHNQILSVIFKDCSINFCDYHICNYFHILRLIWTQIHSGSRAEH